VPSTRSERPVVPALSASIAGRDDGVVEVARTGDRARGSKYRAPGPRRFLTVSCWIALAAWTALVLADVALHDFRTQPLAGDTASHLMQAVSVSQGDHRLGFDAQDLERWKSLDWTDQPVGMFYQRYDDGAYGLAKPYGYSVFAAPFIALLGPVRGVAVANAVLLGMLVVISIFLLRTRFGGPAVPIGVAAFYLASYAYLYAYWTHSELFLALVTLVALFGVVRFAQTGALRWGLLGFAVMGFGVSEKAAFVALFAPLAVVALWRATRWSDRLAMSAAGLGVLAVAVLPYLHYSDWASITPYGGSDREYVASATPFAGGTTGFFESGGVEGTRIWDELRGPVSDKALAAAYMLIGRHTGLLVFMPLALLLIVVGGMRYRRADAWGRAALLGVVAYLAFYAIFFPTNYFGGGQSLGNRYFLQAAPAVLALVVLIAVDRRALLAASLLGAALGLLFLWPHHERPAAAHVYLERTNKLQRLLPFEANQETASYFRCERYVVGNITVCDLAAAEGR
jgi:4-amino-4-deoxy-L-arabinose transferase-like glycosyltransferase